MSRRVWLFSGLGLALLAALVWFVLARRDSDRATAVVTLGSLDVTIQTTGRITARDAVIVRASAPGAIEALGAEVGDTVQAGDIIAQQDAAPFERAIENAELAVSDAEFGLQLAETRLADEPNNRERQADVVIAVGRVESANRALDDAEAALRESVILAPSDGIVLEVLVQVGAVVTQSQPVARMYTAGELEVLADVDELDLPNVAPGAVARFRPDSFPAAEIEGRVGRVAPEAREQGGATVFTTVIAFDAPADLDLRPGMNASVTIVTAERADVLVIPERALRTVGARYFVTVVVDGRNEEREVLIGQRGGGLVEIVSGLAAGDEVELR